MIRAAFFDVDGTLLSHKTKRVPPSTRAALEKLKEKGILCIIATGRQMVELEKLPGADLQFDAYITLNGQMVLDADKEIIFATELTGDAKEYLVRAFREKTVPVGMVERNRLYINYVDDLVRTLHKSISSEVPEVDEYRECPIYQVCVYLNEGEEHFLDPVRNSCVVTAWHFGGYDVIAEGGGKMQGIKRYLRENGLKREEIIAFGDGENDIDMLAYAGIGVAMGNAVEGAKAAADYVTADIDEDGIEKALKYYGLI